MVFITRLLYIIFLIIFLSRNYSQHHCPCDDTSSWNLEYNNYPALRNLTSSHPLSLCINIVSITNPHHISLFQRLLSSQSSISSQHEDFEIIVIARHTADQIIENTCHGIIHLYDSMNESIPRTLCPGICHPIPDRRISIQSILQKHEIHHQHQQPHHHPANNQHHKSHINDRNDNMHHLYDDMPITCTLTRAMLFDSNNKLPDLRNQKRGIMLHHRMKALLWRMIMECYEKKHWYHRYLRSLDIDTEIIAAHDININHHIPRRQVESVVIWIGNRAGIDLIQEQALTLSQQPLEGSHAVLGWAATDDSYDCNVKAMECAMMTRRGRQYIPRSTINQYNHGWRCAQRRPLRALSHILNLIDATFIALGDDDTFINYPLLVNRFNSTLYGSMLQEAIVLGELTGAEGDTGHFTRKGFYAGGAGYILGKELLRVLVKYEVKYWEAADNPASGITADGDAYRSKEQIMGLSVVADMIPKFPYCSSNRTCINLNPKPRLSIHHHSFSASDTVVSIRSRLIDVCVNHMANDNTCLHSDHSMTQCLAYAAYAKPMGSICHSLVDDVESNPNAKDLLLGMCFMAPTCDVHKHVTCHRYKPKRVDGESGLSEVKYTAVPITRNKGHYKVYSSMFDGNKSDTYLRRS